MKRDEVKARILEVLREGPKSSTEIRDRVYKTCGEVSPQEIRLALAELVREGKVLKVPDYSLKKFLFRLP
jgi:DNA-binding PadR family transcriptional regulator